jgi:hypothetical protein
MVVNMLVLLNVRERDGVMWRALLQSADARFTWVGVRWRAGSALAVVDAFWADALPSTPAEEGAGSFN